MAEPPRSFPRDVRVAGGRILRVHEAGPGPAEPAFTLVWHHGTPQTGALIPPLVDAAAAHELRLVSYARPSYGGSTAQPGRNVLSAGRDVEAIADALGIGRFAVMGASGGAPHALACAALLPDRVLAAVTLAGLAPFTESFDWFDGMAASGALRSAREGRAARARFGETHDFDPSSFVDADWAALAGTWQSLGADAAAAGQAGSDGEIDDDVAFASSWGFEPESVAVPVLVVQGGRDRVVPPSHGRSLVERLPNAELWLRPGDGHVSVLDAVPVAMEWLRERVTSRRPRD